MDLVDVGELLHPGVNEEAFEREHARLRQRREVVGISRNDTADESHVDVTPSSRNRLLALQRIYGVRRRDAVERHVE
jgi:hypothetical protein